MRTAEGPSLVITGVAYLNWSMELAALRTFPYIPARLVSVSLKRTGTFRRRVPVKQENNELLYRHQNELANKMTVEHTYYR